MSAGWMHRADTMIRAVLGLDPDSLADAEWAHQAAMAQWMEDYRASRIARLFAGK